LPAPSDSTSSSDLGEPSFHLYFLCHFPRDRKWPCFLYQRFLRSSVGGLAFCSVCAGWLVFGFVPGSGKSPHPPTPTNFVESDLLPLIASFQFHASPQASLVRCRHSDFSLAYTFIKHHALLSRFYGRKRAISSSPAMCSRSC